MYMTIRLWTSLIMDLIGPKLWVICPSIRKFSIFDFVYSLSCANIDQSVPNLATIYIDIKSRMSLIMGQMESENRELFALEFFKNCWIWHCLHSSIYKYWPISAKLDQNVYDHRISDEFDYGCNQTRTLRVVYPWIRKFNIFDFVYTLASANIDQSVPNLVTVYMPIKSRMSLIMGQIEPEHSELFALEFGKIAESDFVYTLASTNINQWAPNWVKMNVTIRSWMSLIMDLIEPELS